MSLLACLVRLMDKKILSKETTKKLMEYYFDEEYYQISVTIEDILEQYDFPERSKPLLNTTLNAAERMCELQDEWLELQREYEDDLNSIEG